MADDYKGATAPAFEIHQDEFPPSSPAETDSQTGFPSVSSAASTNSGEQPSKHVGPFDPMSLGISTDYAAAIDAQAKAKPYELRKPSDQEFFRTSPVTTQQLVVVGIMDKQDMSRVYIVSGPLRESVIAMFPKFIRGIKLGLAQTLAGARFVWPVPLAEDRGGAWHSTHRAAFIQGQSRWTNMSSGHGQYDCLTVINPKEVNWESFPPFNEILREAASERLIESLEHPLLRKLRGEMD